MNSLIFNVTVRLLKPAIYVVAFWLFMRGHNAPGGGFIAGLVAATAVLLDVLGNGWKSLPAVLRNNLFALMGIGLLISVISGVVSFSVQNPFMTGRWGSFLGMKLGTPMLFDLGVFVVVFAVVVVCTGFLLEEEESQ